MCAKLIILVVFSWAALARRPEWGQAARNNQLCQTNMRVKLLNDEFEIDLYLFNVSRVYIEFRLHIIISSGPYEDFFKKILVPPQ